MVRFVNSFALSTKRIASAEIGPLGMVAHPVTRPGRYIGHVCQGEEQVGQFELLVEDGNDQTQADIDLSKLATRGGEGPRRAARFKMAPEGFAIFFVSQGAGGYHVTLEAQGKEKKGAKSTATFDSRKLGAGDLFVATLLRPGVWTAYDRPSSGQAEITVGYPKMTSKPYRPSEKAAVIAVKEGGMSPKSVRIGPGEGVVFQIGTKAASIVLDLSKPDDGDDKKSKKQSPSGKSSRKVRWTNPRASKS